MGHRSYIDEQGPDIGLESLTMPFLSRCERFQNQWIHKRRPTQSARRYLLHLDSDATFRCEGTGRSGSSKRKYVHIQILLSLSLSLTLHDMPCLCSFDAICQYVHAPDQLVWCERFVVPWSDTAIAAILQSKFISDRSGQIEFVERIGIALTALGFQTGRGWVSHVCWDWSEKTHLLCAWQDQISWIPSRSN